MTKQLLRDKIDATRREMATAAWAATDEDTRTDVVRDYAQKITALYRQLDAPRAAPNVTGLQLAGRAKDGSYIFTASGTIAKRPNRKKEKLVKRKASNKPFAPDYYRHDSEFNELVRVELMSAYTGNDLIFAEKLA